MYNKKSFSGIVFDVCNTIFMIFLIIITIYPFLYILLASFSNPSALIKVQGLLLKPVGVSLDGYSAVLRNKDIVTGYLNTIAYVVVGTSASVLVTSLLAYALSRKRLKYAKHMMLFILFTMFFSGGMIPTYLVVKSVGLVNTRWAMILPTMLSTYNLIVMRTSFMGIPDSMEESARIDGANDLTILFRIILPLSSAVIAVMVLFYGVGQWNAWFNAMLYLKDRSLFPLQLILREILITSSTDNMMLDASTGNQASLEEVVKYATIVVATVPILAIYPFLQKYFVKGVMIGALKG